MAPTPQPTMTREQQQALAKARARARVGAQTVNPMVAQGQAAQQVWQDAGSKPANPNPENPIVTAQRNSQTQVMGQWAQQREAERQAEATRAKARRESAAAFGGGMDMLPTEDAAGNVRPGTEIDADLSKGIVTAPLQFGQGLGEGVANMANVGFAASTDLYNAGANLIDPQRAQIQPYKLEFPRNALLEGPGASVTGIAPRIAGQIMSARVPIGRAMPGGGFGAEVAKDAMAMGLGTPQDAPRLSDMIDPGTPVIGGIANFLKTNPGDNALAAAAKNAAEDLLISGGIGAALRRGATVLDSVGSRAPLPQTNAGGAAVRAPSQATAVQQSAPVTQVPMPQPASRAAQAGPSSAGQQPNAGNAAPAASAAPAAAQPVLNATPAVAQSPVALAKSDAKIIGRLLRAGGVARNDVDRTLAGLVQAYQSSNSSRLPLAFFAEEYLPTVLPKQAAEDVIQKLRGFGRERYSANGPRDSSRATMRETVDTLRGSQREVLTKEFEDTLGKETLLNKKGKIKRDKSSVAEAVYREELDRQQRLLDDGKATPEQVAARDDLLMLMGREDYFAEVPKELKIQALDEGRSSLWEFIHQNPIEAAHWMQSRMGELASKGNSIANTMRWPLVRRLEEAVPGYRGARLDYGDLFGQEKQIKFGDDLFSVAGNVLKTGEKAAEYKRLAPSQKTVAEKSIRDKLVNEFRKAKAGDDRAAVITQMQKDGVLDALETILGAKGRRVADGIRAMVKENDRLRAVDMLSGSNTADNLKQIEAAQEAVRSPVNKAIGAVGDKQSWTNTIVGDALLAANGLPPLLTGSKIATGVVGKFGSPGPKKLSSATRTLYGLPTQTSPNALAAEIEPPPARFKVEKPKPTKLTVTQDSLDALLKQYDQKPTAALRTKIIAARKALAKQPPANALASPPPSGPINKAGFGGAQAGPVERHFGKAVTHPPYTKNKEAWSRLQAAKNDNASRTANIETVPLSKIIATQADIESDFASVQARYGEADNQFPVLVKYNGRYYVDDGHHRLVGAAESGAKDTRARVIDLDASDANARPQQSSYGGGRSSSLDMSEPARMREALEQKIADLSERYRQADGAADRHYIQQEVYNLQDEIANLPSQSGSSKLLAGMGGRVGSQVAPPAFAATVASVGPEGEAPEDKWTRMAAAAALTVGVRNLPALRNFASKARGSDQATFGGINAKTADLKLKGIAEQMEKAGAGRDQIWKETGWFKGVDGKWRFEIDDSRAGFNAATRKEVEQRGGRAQVGKGPDGVYLKTAFNHSEAKNAYPEYEWAGVKGEINPKAATRGAFRDSPYGEGQVAGRRIDFRAPNLDEGRSVILHEGQHGIQSSEGFARGGSPEEQMAALKAQRQGDVAPIHDEMRDVLASADRNTYETWNEFVLARVNRDVERIGQIEDMLASTDTGKRLLDLDWKARSIGSGSISPDEGFDAYRRLAGEVEARNVQTRRDFTPEERRARPPWTTQDVPDDQQIVRFNSGEARSEPTPPRSITIASGKADNGKGYTVTAEAYNDRGRMVLSPEWPTSAFDEMHAARLKRAEELLYPDLHRPKPTLVDENYGKPKPPRPEWEVENPKAAAEIGRKVADRFVGLMNADPSPVHVLALKEGVDIQSIGEMIERGLPKNRQIFIAKDGGEIAVVDKAWHRQNPQEYTPELWNRMWPGSVTREGRRYGWKGGRPFVFSDEAPKPPPAQAGFSFGGGGKRPPNALKDAGMPGPISPRVLEDATKAAGRLSPEARNKLRANAFSDDPAPAMQASGFDPNLFSFAQDARTPPPGKVQNAFARLTGQPTASPLERGLQKSIESVAGQRGRSALRVGNEDVPDLPFGMRMAMGERNATRKEQALARRAYTRAEKADKLDADKVKRVVVAEREARVAQEILDQARLDAFSAEDVGAIVREQMDAIAKAMNREPPSTLGLPTKGQRVSDALDDVVFGAPPKGARARPKAKDATYSASEADDAAKLLFSKEYARVWDDIVSGRTPVESIKPGSKEHLVLTVAAVGGIGALGVTSALLADRSGPMQEPHYPKPEDPRVHFDWTKQRTNRRFVENLQTRFNQIDRRYQLREDGIWSEGGDTDKVIRFWQSENGFAPDGNLTEDQVALIEEQAIEALRAEPVGGRSGQPKRPARRNALAQAQ